MAGEKVLIVDDDNEITMLLEFILKEGGYATFVAHNGEDGIKIALEEKPDILVLDLMMPGIDGFQVCAKLKSDDTTKNIPIIMLTALGMGKDFEKGLESGADWYITKPFESQHLIKRIKYLLEAKKKGNL